MRILLVGEFSGVHNNLKDGLEKLGHEVLLVSNNGDGFKKFNYDLDIDCNFENNFYGKIHKFIKKCAFFSLVKKYDVVQFIHPGVLTSAGYSEKYVINMLKEMKKRGKALFMLACGCDALYFSFCKYNKKYPCTDCKEIDSKNNSCAMKYNKIYKKYDIVFMKNMDKIVTCAYDYNLIYRKYKPCFLNKLSDDMVSLPINTDKLRPSSNKYEKRKIVVYHPLNRIGFKGTLKIKQAFLILEKRYGKRVEFIIKGQMPIDKYEKFLNKVDILVEQFNFMSYGMSAIYAMAKGKMVVTGCINEMRDDPFIGFMKEAPTYDLGYTVDEMVNRISYILEHEYLIDDYKKKSRQYVEKYHNYIKVARKYVDMYNEILNQNIDLCL